jgi:hypothetical protein
MANTELALSRSFIEQQQRRLEALQKELLGAEGKTLGNERAYQEDHGEEPQEVAISVQREIACRGAELRLILSIDVPAIRTGRRSHRRSFRQGCVVSHDQEAR